MLRPFSRVAPNGSGRPHPGPLAQPTSEAGCRPAQSCNAAAAALFLKLRVRLLGRPLNQSQKEQQDDCADEGVDDRSDHAATDYNAELR